MSRHGKPRGRRLSQWVMVLALGLIPVASQAQQARAIPPSQLPPDVRAQFARRGVVKLSAAKPDTVAATEPTILHAGEVLAARTGDRATLFKVVPRKDSGGRSPASEKLDSTFALPFTWVGFDTKGETPAYRPVYIPQGGLRYQASLNAFEGSFLIRLDLVNGDGDSVGLARPISLTFGGDADMVAPPSMEFTHAGGSYDHVRVVARNPLDSVRVQIVPQFDNAGVPIYLSVHPALTFERPPKSIQGYGIETATLVIGTRGPVGKDSIVVAVSADRGTLSTHQLRIGPLGGEVTLRSAGGLGMDTVRIVAAGLGSAEAGIEFAPPVRFVLAALFGAVLGALYAQSKQRKLGKPASVLRNMIGATLGAVLATSIYVGLGISLIPVATTIPLGNEVAVFAFAAFGAMAGVKVPKGGTQP